MPTRRQEKVARVVKEVVCDALANHLSDPRIEGFISVTKVDVAPNMRNVDVYLSIFAAEPSTSDQNEGEQAAATRQDTAAKKTFIAITHAKTRIQSLLARRMQSKYCPCLHFRMDEDFKKTLDTMRLIEEAAKEFRKHDDEDTRQ